MWLCFKILWTILFDRFRMSATFPTLLVPSSVNYWSTTPSVSGVRTVRSTPPTHFLSGTKEPVVLDLFTKRKNMSELGYWPCGKRSRYSLATALELTATFPVDDHHFGVFFGSEHFLLCCCPKIDTFQMYELMSLWR
jgi:hypothetical protein